MSTHIQIVLSQSNFIKNIHSVMVLLKYEALGIYFIIVGDTEKINFYKSSQRRNSVIGQRL